MHEYNLVTIAPNIGRIYEIAKAGNFKVKLITSNEPPIDSKDVELFNNFYGFDPDEKNPDILAQLCFHHSDILNAIATTRKSETIQDIHNRIAQFDFKELTVDRTIKSTCRNLLNNALEKLSLGLHDTLKIIDIAEVIAKLSFSKEIKIEHIAEAIQYRSIKIDKDGFVI